MVTRWPARLLLDLEQLTVLASDLRAVAPEEGCCLLLGRWGGEAEGALELTAIWPCRNVWEPASERRCRFAVDPREQLHAQRWVREKGWQVIGTAHSHPGSAPVPSVTDRNLAVPPTLMVIVGMPPEDDTADRGSAHGETLHVETCPGDSSGGQTVACAMNAGTGAGAPRTSPGSVRLLSGEEVRAWWMEEQVDQLSKATPLAQACAVRIMVAGLSDDDRAADLGE